MNDPGTQSLLDLRGVSRTYLGHPAVTALHPTDLRIHAGDYLAVLGPSGSGKSTLLNLLGLLDRPTAGTYRFDGTDVDTLGERERTALRGRRIGFVFQSFQLLPHRTTLDNVALALLYHGVGTAERRRRAAASLERVGMTHRAHALPGTLSGGERQRVAIARALCPAPAVLLCDEPTGNLDSRTASSVMDVMDQLNQEGVTLVVITHDAAVASRAHRRVRILDGRLTRPSTITAVPA